MNQTTYHPIINPHHLAKVRLFCFYHAGGNSSIFRAWAQSFGPMFEIVAVEFPGHGQRVYEPLATSMEQLVPQLAEELAPLFAEKACAFFGHSMGALVSFELARYLRHHGMTEPQLLFVSGRQAPQFPPRTAFHTLADAEFIQTLSGLDGTPASVLEHPELMELFLPIIRADFQLCETYQYQSSPALAYPIVAYGGKDDHSVDPRLLEYWCEQTQASFECRLFTGGHFYLRDAQTALLQSIRGHLLREVLLNQTQATRVLS